jgi:hypothetical protein
MFETLIDIVLHTCDDLYTLIFLTHLYHLQNYRLLTLDPLPSELVSRERH